MAASEGVIPLSVSRTEMPQQHERPLADPVPGAERRPWFDRLLRRRQMTTYQRCLAVHIHFAGPRSALS